MRELINPKGVECTSHREGFGSALRVLMALLLVAMITGLNLFAQETSIKGKVTDSEGNPIAGANVILKGTMNGTITDLDGNYTISNIPSDGILVFSFVGMLTEEVAYAGQSVVDLTLVEDIESIQELVVIGFGTSTKKKLVGAVSSANSEQFEQKPQVSLGEALQGRIPGVIVNSTGGAPGDKADIWIRGEDKPLIVIDGVEIGNDKDAQAIFAGLDPSEVETITALKDASATAVYGADAAGGILLVTTKKGSKGKMQVNYSYDYMLSEPTLRPKNINAYEYLKLQNEAFIMDGDTAHFTQGTLDSVRLGLDPLNYPSSDWDALVLNKYAKAQRHNLSFSGGSDNSTYFFNLGYVDQGGITKADEFHYDRLTVRSNLTTSVNKIGLTIGGNFAGNLQNTQAASQGAFRHIYKTPAYLLAYNPDGTIGTGPNHPLAYSSTEAGFEELKHQNVSSKVYVKWDVPWIKGLTITPSISYASIHVDSTKFEHLAPQYDLDGVLFNEILADLHEGTGYSNKTDIESNITYQRSFGLHTIEATYVYTQFEKKSKYFNADRENYRALSVPLLFAGPEKDKTNEGGAGYRTSMAHIGRLKYDYASKYVLEVNGRYDGVDAYHPDRRWGFFPSGAVSWVASEEGFMQPLKDRDILNLLKFRVSLGEIGLTKGEYDYIFSYDLNAGDYSYGGELGPGFTEGDLVKPLDLTWYKVHSRNVGIDFATLGNRIEGNFDYFYTRTSGYPVSPKNEGYTETLGAALPKIKSKSAKRKEGFDASLRYKGRFKDGTFSVGGTITYYDQLWERKDDEDSVSLMNPAVRETHRRDTWGQTYDVHGLYQTPDEILNSARWATSEDLQLGNVHYIDQNGDGQITSADKVRLGNPTRPHLVYGFDLGATYKGFFLNALITGTGKRSILLYWDARGTFAKDMVREVQMDYWTPENTDAQLPRITHTNRNPGNDSQISTLYLREARFVRLKSLQIGYEITDLFKRQDFIKSCKIMISGSNLLTISQVKEWIDPETNLSNEDLKVENDEREKKERAIVTGYPVQRTYSFGINLKF